MRASHKMVIEMFSLTWICLLNFAALWIGHQTTYIQTMSLGFLFTCKWIAFDFFHLITFYLNDAEAKYLQFKN